MTTVPITLNRYQLQLVEAAAGSHGLDGGTEDAMADILRRWLEEHEGAFDPRRDDGSTAARASPGREERRPVPDGANVTARELIEPATGKGLVVRRGQVLRVEQVSDGQCLDFNAYNLYDPGQHLHSLRTLSFEGAWPTVGNHLWSRPPDETAMFTIIADTVGHNDTLGARCSAALFRRLAGVEYHPNCQDIFTEAIREWGLRPRDTHDSVNFFMNTELDAAGRLVLKRNFAKRGDYVELLAHLDVLAVTVACGSSLSHVSNFESKGLAVTVYEATAEQRDRSLRPDTGIVEEAPLQMSGRSARLTADPSYRPNWSWLPLAPQTFRVPLSVHEASMLERVVADGAWGDTAEEAARAAVVDWAVTHRAGAAARGIRL